MRAKSASSQALALLLAFSSIAVMLLVVLLPLNTMRLEQNASAVRLDADNMVLRLAYRDARRQVQQAAPKCPEPEPAVHSCAPDPLAGDCAVSYFRLMEKPKGHYTVSCGSSWVIRWHRVKHPVD